MKLNELISKLQEMSDKLGDVEVIVRGRLGFISDIEAITDDRSHDDDSPFVSIDVDEIDEDEIDYSEDEPDPNEWHYYQSES